jgi:asparagine synthetase B (glutamine-hydrolysing)
MCGIYCSIGLGNHIHSNKETRELLKARGPDSLQELSAALDRERVNIHVLSTVLALRGDHVESQPLQAEHSQSFLCWNGEAWKQNGQMITGNDSRYVYSLLRRACLSTQSPGKAPILDTLTSIAGPFAFVFYDATSCQLFYGRDYLGRRSLLSRVFPDGGMELCSITDGSQSPSWSEVETGGVHVIDLSKSPLSQEYWPWPVSRPQINQALPQGQPNALGASSPAVLELERHLNESLRLRISDIPSLHPAIERRACEDANIAILFSGGLDCTVLARLAHDQLPLDEPIDLLNVAFENPRSMAAVSKTEPGVSPYESCPDRRTGRSSHLELLRICGGRRWRFIAIDIPYSESETHRDTILRLMDPHNTEMDLSIAKALYFAARGEGHIIDLQSQQARPYSTQARVLLSGLGADELFGGYTRHARACAHGGYQSLINELDLDIQRLGQRNLGRDDRIISHRSKEVRYPYLDEDFMAWALRLPVWEKCGFVPSSDLLCKENIDPETTLDPAKQVLRLLARLLGMEEVANAKKRAIQFGARTAKMTIGTGRAKGTDFIT